MRAQFHIHKKAEIKFEQNSKEVLHLIVKEEGEDFGTEIDLTFYKTEPKKVLKDFTTAVGHHWDELNFPRQSE